MPYHCSPVLKAKAGTSEMGPGSGFRQYDTEGCAKKSPKIYLNVPSRGNLTSDKSVLGAPNAKPNARHRVARVGAGTEQGGPWRGVEQK